MKFEFAKTVGHNIQNFFKGHRVIRRISLTVIAVLVAVCTLYALILPGMTVSGTVYDLNDNIKNVTLKQQENGAWVDVDLSSGTGNISSGNKLRFSVDYTVPGGALGEEDDTVRFELGGQFTTITGKTGAIKDGLGNTIGSYDIDQNCIISLTYTGDTLDSIRSGTSFNGNITFDCSADSIIGENETGSITIGSQTFFLSSIPAASVKDDLSITKTGEIVDPLNGIVEYTLVVNSKNGTTDAPTIIDEMTTDNKNCGLEYLDGFRVVYTANNNPIADATPTITSTGSKNKFSYVFPGKFNPGDSYTITYRAQTTNSPQEHTKTINQVKGIANNESVQVTARFDKSFNNNFLHKDGTIVTVDNEEFVDWTITLEATEDMNLKDWQLTDILEGAPYTGNVTMETSSNSNQATVSFPYTFTSSTNTDEDYIFTYRTPYTRQIGSTGYTNRVNLAPTDSRSSTWDKPFYSQDTVGDSSSYNPLYKHIADNGNAFTVTPVANTNTGDVLVTWVVDLHPTHGDLYSSDYGTGYSWQYDDTLYDGMYITEAQKTALLASIDAGMNNPTENFSFTYGTDYTVRFERQEQETEIPEGTYNYFCISTSKTLPNNSSLRFQYDSCGTVENLKNKQTFKNHGKIMQSTPDNTDGFSAWSDPVAIYHPVMHKFDPIPSTNEKDADEDAERTTHYYKDVNGILTWDLTTAIPSGITSAVTVTDTLPTGLTMDNIKVKVSGDSSKRDVVWATEDKLSGSVDLGNGKQINITRSGNTITMVINDVAAQYYINNKLIDFFVTANVTNIPDPKHPAEYENNVTVTIPNPEDDPDDETDDTILIGEDTHVQEVTSDLYEDALTKIVNVDAYDKDEGVIPYRIVVNPNGFDLIDNSDTLRLIDDLDYWFHANYQKSIQLRQESLKIYNYDPTAADSRGTEISHSDYSYTYNTTRIKEDIHNLLTITIPDERALLIEYEYVITAPNDVSKLEVSNNVELQGVTSKKVDSNTVINIDYTSTSASGSLDGISLHKVDSRNYSVGLANASFRVMKYNGTSHAYELDTTIGTNGVVTTDTNGLVNITGLQTNIAYQLIETVAPQNYKLDKVPYNFILAGSGTQVKPDNFSGDTLMQGDSVYRPNESSLTSINIEKIWKDHLNNSVDHDGSIQFELYRKIVPPSNNVSLSVTITETRKGMNKSWSPTPNPSTYQVGDEVTVNFTKFHYKPNAGNNNPGTLNILVNGQNVTLNPSWEQKDEGNENAPVHYSYTFVIAEDTTITGSFQNPYEKAADVIITTEKTGQGEVTTKYNINFTSAGKAQIDGVDVIEAEKDQIISLVRPTLSSGQTFLSWSVTGPNGPVTVNGTTSGNETFTMPEGDVTVYANIDTSYSITLPANTTATISESSETVTQAHTGDVIVLHEPSGLSSDTIVKWTVEDKNHNPLHLTNGNTFTMPSSNVTVKVSYEYPITIIDNLGTAIVQGKTAEESTSASYGQLISLVPPETPPAGKVFDSWTVTGPDGVIEVSSDGKFTMPNGAITIKANFVNASSSHTITFDGIYQGTAKVNDVEVHSANEGDLVTLLPPTGHPDNQSFDHWELDGVSLGNDTTFEMPDHDVVLTPIFRDGPYIITKLDGADAIVGGSSISAAEEDTEVLLVHPEKIGYNFIEWNVYKTGDAGTTVSVSDGGTITMPGYPITIEPVFTQAYYNITIDDDDNIGISSSVNQACYNDTVTLSYTGPLPTGYVFDEWVVMPTESGSTPITVTNGEFTMPPYPVTVSATLKPQGSTDTYTLSVDGYWKENQYGECDVVIPATNYTPSKTVTYEPGSTATITLTYTNVYKGSGKTSSWGDGIVLKTDDNIILPLDSFSKNGNDLIFTYKLVMNKNEHVTITSNPDDRNCPLIDLDGTSGGGGEPTASTSATTTSSTPSSDTPLWRQETILDRITLSFVDKAATKYGITFHTYDENNLQEAFVQYVQGDNATAAQLESGSSATASLSTYTYNGNMQNSYDPSTQKVTSYNASDITSVTDKAYKATLIGLAYDTTYSYRVGGRNSKGELVYSDIYSFTTRPQNPGDNMSFLWLSDSQYSTSGDVASEFRTVLNGSKTVLSSPDMILHGGDFTDDANHMWAMSAQISGNEDFFATTPMAIAAGNHDGKASRQIVNMLNIDLSDAGRISSQSANGGPYYSFDYGDVHIVVLEKWEDDYKGLSKTMTDWLANDLNNSNAKWKLVMMHKPIYTCLQDKETIEGYPSVSEDMRKLLAPIFINGGVDVVMQAHGHQYVRTKAITDAIATVDSSYSETTENGYTLAVNPNGPIYTEIAAAGPYGIMDKRPVDEVQPNCIANAQDPHEHSFAAWRIDGDTLYVDACYVKSDGTIGYYEKFGITKDGSVTPTPTSYTATIDNIIEHGSVNIVDPQASYAVGSSINLSVNPDPEYEVGTITITDENGNNSQPVTGNSFTMPAYNVIIHATFNETGGGDEPVTGNMIVNGSFTNGLEGWTYETYSDNYVVNSDGQLEVTARHGSKVCSLTPTIIGLEPSTQYTLHVEMGTTTASGITVKVNLDKNHPITPDPIIQSGNYTFTTPASLAEFKLRIDVPKNSTGITNTFDNFILVKGSSIPSASPEFEEPNAYNYDAPDIPMGDAPGDDEPTIPDEYVDTYTILASNGWHLLIEDLPSDGIVNGQKVHYVYYVVEVTPSDTETVTYNQANVDGVDNPENPITITNTLKEQQEEGYVLPETGGNGTMPFVVTGTACITICLFGGVVMKRKRKRQTSE